MTLSPRLTRATFTFLLFGTCAALLPTLDNSALASNGCFTGPPGTTGQFAIAPVSSDIRDNYLLTPSTTSYNFYYRTDAASAYKQVITSTSTTFVVNSGQVVINSVLYPAGSQSSRPDNKSSFTVAQVITSRNFSGMPTGYAAGSVTFKTTYFGSDATGHVDTSTAVVTISAPASTP